MDSLDSRQPTQMRSFWTATAVSLSCSGLSRCRRRSRPAFRGWTVCWCIRWSAFSPNCIEPGLLFLGARDNVVACDADDGVAQGLAECVLHGCTNLWNYKAGCLYWFINNLHVCAYGNCWDLGIICRDRIMSIRFFELMECHSNLCAITFVCYIERRYEQPPGKEKRKNTKNHRGRRRKGTPASTQKSLLFKRLASHSV